MTGAMMQRAGAGATGAAAGETLVFEDTFTDSDGTNLTDHTPDTGDGWTNQSGNLVIQDNAVYRGSGGSGWGMYTADNAESGEDYTLEFDIVEIALIGQRFAGAVGRWQTGGTDGYYVGYDVNGDELFIRIDDPDTGTDIGTPVTINLSGSSIIKAVFAGSTIKVYVDDVLELDEIDSTYTSGDGVGIFSDSNTDTQGVHLDNFKVYE